jgi:hypothetical protein
MSDSQNVNVYIDVPTENKPEFERLFQWKNELTDRFNKLMSELKPLEPNIHNYKQISKHIASMRLDVDKFCTEVTAWVNDFDAYQMSFQHLFEGTRENSFHELNFKISTSTFRVEMENSKNVILTSFNNTGNWTSAIEAIVIAYKSLTMTKYSLWISILAFLVSILALIYSVLYTEHG